MNDQGNNRKGRNLWYVHHGQEIQGPLPARLIGRYLILGRLSPDTRVSRDARDWHPISYFPELIPDILTSTDKKSGQERLLAARRWEDERSQGDRRSGEIGPNRGPERRSKNDRRHGDAHIQDGTGVRSHTINSASDAIADRRFLIIALSGLGLVIFFLVYLAIQRLDFLQPGLRDCHLPPAPGVTWNHCDKSGESLVRAELSDANLSSMNLSHSDLSFANLSRSDLSYSVLIQARLVGARITGTQMTGIDLRRADLSGADLDGANLSYADLRGAKLTNVNMGKVILDQALWVDGRICSSGSRGKCVNPVERPSLPE